MGTQFSDPAWWPKPPPKPPQRISPAKIVFGTLLPVAAVVAVAVFVIRQQSHSSSRATAPPSIAAFEACLKAHGVTGGERGASVGRAAGACRSELPSGTQPQAFEPARSEAQSRVQQAFEQCVRNAVAAVPGGGGGSFGGRGPNRQAFGEAVAVCRATAQHETTAPAETTTTTVPSVA